MGKQSDTHHQVNMQNPDFSWLEKVKAKWEKQHEGVTWKYGKIIAKLCKNELGTNK